VIDRPWWEFTPRLSHTEWLTLDSPADEHTPTNKTIVTAQHQLIDAYETLLNLQRLVEQERSLARVNEQVTGRPRLMWKTDFVWRMAHLWRLLTGQEPSKADDSLFGSFVYAAWNSFDENIPEISFARAIRERT